MKIFQRILEIIILGGFLGLGLLHYNGNKEAPVIDSRLSELVIEWQGDLDSRGISYNMNMLDHIKVVDSIPGDIFGDGDPMRAGFADQSKRTIFIRNDSNYAMIHVKVILYHELAHYMFNINHVKYGILAEKLEEDPNHYIDNWDIFLLEYLTLIENER